MPLATFNLGDVVTLSSGGPQMTVKWVGEEYGTPTACCSWFDAKGELKENTFAPAQLKLSGS